MYQVVVYICITWYSKFCWFLVKKCWYQQSSRGVSRYIFFGSSLDKVEPSFIIVGYVWKILWSPPPICEQLWKGPSWTGFKKVLLNRVISIRVSQGPFQNQGGLQLYWIKIFWHSCFLVNFAKILRTHILSNIFSQLPLALGFVRALGHSIEETFDVSKGSY